jgi:glycerol-3-phosphate O-acyltransferase/dihydroxyacetone phosphate acyltransferase
MWLLPALSPVCAFAARTYHRLTVAGGQIPATGPVLLVANHPNSILDPVLVAAAARRPVRFLAAATTVERPRVGWVVRAAGAIPVYRRMDDPTLVTRNEEMFRAAWAALQCGDAVGIFPEGVSHDEPRMVAFKTGAARIALGAFAARGATFPIVPVGLVYRNRERFRSPALAIVGPPVPWHDLAPEGVQNAEAVRELTRRIEDALRGVTVNLQRWEDVPIVECAEAIYVAERGARRDPVRRVAHLREATEVLAWLRAEHSDRWASLVRDVKRHARLLARLGLQPDDLRFTPSGRDALRWTIRELPSLALSVVTALGAVVFWPPYRLTRAVALSTVPRPGGQSTAKLIFGLIFFLLWILLMTALAAWSGGLVAAMTALVALPAWALATLHTRDRWHEWRSEVRRFFLRRERAALLRDLEARQKELATRLEALRETFEEARGGVGAGR